MAPQAQKYRDPVRSLNLEVLSNLEMVDIRVYPLPGGKGRRWTNEIDPRLSSLVKTGSTPIGEDVVFYEHIASVRDKRTKTFYIAFRETADAQLASERDLVKYPEWLMKSNEKQRERMIFIYLVMKHPKDIPIMRSHEDWLAPIADAAIFDAVWHFLAQNHIMPAQ
jgi:hypothetical protein